MADYDAAIKSGKLDYEEALTNLVVVPSVAIAICQAGFKAGTYFLIRLTLPIYQVFIHVRQLLADSNCRKQ